MTFLESLARYGRRGMAALFVALIATLLIVMCLQIVFRYGFNASLIWAEELCRYLLIWASFLGCAAAYERGEIAAVTILRDAAPGRIGLAIAILGNLLILGLLGTLVVYGLTYAERIGSQPVPALRFLLDDLAGAGDSAPAMYWVYLALPIGMGMLGLVVLAETVRAALLFVRGGSLADLGAHDGGSAA